MDEIIYRYFCILENDYVEESRPYGDKPIKCKNDTASITDVTGLGSHLGASDTNNPISSLGSFVPITKKKDVTTTISPTVNDDSSRGYSIGSRWIDLVGGKFFICISDSIGSALWKLVSATSTSDLTEGSNLFYTDMRFDTRLATKTTTHLIEGVNLYHTEARVASNSSVASNTTHRGRTDNPHIVTKAQVGLSEVENLKYNLNATSSPTINDDITEGYGVGSRWIDRTNDREYVCIDESEGLALWKSTSINTTSDLTEGTNLYYTDTRFDNRLSTKTTDNLTEGTNLYYTDARADARIDAQKAQSNGLATLDGTGKIPSSQLNVETTVFQGTWNASTNTPTITSSVGTNGHFYIISVAGSTSIDGESSWGTGDWIIFNGIIWEKVDYVSDVTSVAGKQGAVTLVSSDITDLSTTTVSEGTNLYYTNARFDNRLTLKTTSDIAEGTNLYYTDERVMSNSDVSSNTIHRGKTDNPHGVTKAQVGLDNVDNIKMNFAGTSDPTLNDDLSAGYSVGSIWVNVLTDKAYVCLNSIPTLAIWKHITGINTNDITEGTNLYYTNARVDAQFSTKTTDDLTEGTNLYYTDGRVDARFVTKTTSDLTEGTNLYYTDERVDTRFATKTTDDLAEGASLYYTDTRVSNNSDVQSNVTHRGKTDNPHNVTKTQIGLSNVENINNKLDGIIPPTSTDDQSQGYSIGSLWIDVTNQKIYICEDNTNGIANWIHLSALNSDEITEGSNLYYTNERFDNRLATKTTDDIVEGTNLYYTDERVDTRFSSKTTSDLTEGTNLYYTNTRFDNRLATKTSTNLAEGVNLYYTDQRVSSNSNVTANTLHRGQTNNPHAVTKTQLGLSEVENLKNNLLGTTKPTVNDDIDEGYAIGSRWLNTINHKEYVCVDSTADTAIWKETTIPYIYDAVVDINGKGDYTSISTAFTAGHSSVFVKAGTYYETTDIVIPDGGILTGDAAARVFIVLIGNVSIKADGNQGQVESNGTISIISGTKTVTGIGTTFTNLSAEDYILISHTFLEIESIESDTSLTTKFVYNGVTVTNDSYIAHTMHSGVFIRNIVIVNSVGVGVFLRGLRHSMINTTTVLGCGANLQVKQCGSIQLGPMSSMSSGSIGIDISDTYSATLLSCEITGSAGNGINFSGSCENFIINGMISSDNSGMGVNFTNSCKDINIIDSIMSRNKQTGINTDPSTGNILIGNCTVTENGGDGIDFDGDRNMISNCIILQNDGLGISAGDSGVICNTQIEDNTGDGINMIDDHSCVVNGNRIVNNGGIGITIDKDENTITDNYIAENLQGILLTGSNNNMICNNIIRNNTNEGIKLQSTSTLNLVNDNRVVGNTVGIDVTVGCDECMVQSNFVNNNSSHGIYIGSNKCLLTGNKAITNGGDGCKIDSGAQDNFVLVNHFENNVGTDFNDNGTIIALPPILINRLDTRNSTSLLIGNINSTKVEIAKTSVVTETKGPLNTLGNLNVTGTITSSGLINGRDVINDGSRLDSHLANISNPHSITASQVGKDTAQWNANRINGVIIDTTNLEDGDTLAYSETQNKYIPSKPYEDETVVAVFDEFDGSSLSLKWVIEVTNDATVGIIDAVGGQVKLTSGTTLGNYGMLSFGKKIVSLTSQPQLKYRIKINSMTNTTVNFGLISDNDNLIDFYYDVGGTAGNWLCKTVNAGTVTSLDSNVPADVNWHIFEINGTQTEVKFLIDGISVATFTTNLHPSLMKVYIKQTAKNSTEQYTLCDYVKFTCNREGITNGGGGSGDCVLF